MPSSSSAADSSVAFDTKLTDVPGISERALEMLHGAGFSTVADVLTHYPRRHEDRRRFDAFPDAPSTTPVCLHGIVTSASRRFAGRRRFFEATIEPAEDAAMGGSLTCRWFNMPWMHKVIAADQSIIVFGKPKKSGRRIVMDHPDFEVVEGDSDRRGPSVHMERITPIFPLRDSLRQRPLREAVFDLSRRLDPDSAPNLLRAPAPGTPFEGMSRARALRSIHFPESPDELDLARRYLALEEFFVMQLNVLHRKQAYAEQPGAAHPGSGEMLARLLDSLPFQPTGAQRRAIEEVRADMAEPRPMHRLLQGDVGSGKTLVAAAAMLTAAESGVQAALMAPTQILAEQHFMVIRHWVEPLGVRVALHTSARREDTGDLPLFAGPSASDQPDIVIGTHALLYENAALRNLGLIVIDEQHKFGVAQRARLVERGTVPDLLVMTATPIPRTLTMTAYGDLDVSTLDELPQGRRPVTTAVRAAAKTSDVAAFVRRELEAGRQTYIVCPLIEESDALDAKAAEAEFAAWSKRLAPHPCALLHGRLPAAEKEDVMSRFRDGASRVLVTTTVIEVGVDVPNASVMLVHNAERFGLAQLHQLRGRIGRGPHKSYCILLCHSANPDALEKLAVLEKTSDGFEVAEADLRLRGPGDVLGTAQSGLPNLQLGDLIADATLVRLARSLAAEIIAADPDLTTPPHARLRNLIDTRQPALRA